MYKQSSILNLKLFVSLLFVSTIIMRTGEQTQMEIPHVTVLPPMLGVHTMSISISIDNEEGQIEVRTPGTVSPVIEEGLIKETKNTAANNCTVCLRYSWTIAQIIGFMLVCVWIAFMATLVPQSMDTIHNFITRMI
eukprot:34525_1